MKKLLLFVAVPLFAASFSFSDLLEREPSRARDFATLLYMESEKDAVKNRTLFYNTLNPKPAHIDRLLENTGSKPLRELVECRAKGTKELLNAKSDCLAVALTPARAEHLSDSEKRLVANRVRAVDPFKAAIFEAMASGDPFGSNDKDLFFAIALGASESYFAKLFDKELSSDLIRSTASDERMAKVLERAATTGKGTNIAKYLKQSDLNQLDAKGAFFLGIMLLENKQEALNAFKISQKKAYSKELVDRAIFWQYQVSGDKNLLTELANSNSINIYSLYARDLLGLKYPAVIRSVGGGSTKPTVKESELYDPFFWADLIKKINRGDDLDKELNSLGTGKEYEPYRAAISYWKNSSAHLFLDPFADLMKKYSKDEKALFLAIMRQESRFIPAALSTSYAMGTMQMMPFLTEHMKKERKDKRPLWEFFNPNHQIPYAKKHIEWLERKVAHPLYIAYAYNGGLGYTNRTIEGYGLFGKGSYEPFLSMERMTIEETREYGKIVLANYAVYLDLFGKDQKLLDLIEMLTPTGKLLD